MDTFETFPEQEEAKSLLRAALAEGPAHAYLFHGPRGVGKRRAALAFAGALLGDPDRATRSASTRCAIFAATCTCARSRRRGASTSFSRHTR